MKRFLIWAVGVGGAVAVAVALAVRPALTAENAAPSDATPAAPTAAAAAGGEEGRVVQTFTDDAAFNEFATLWDQRRVMLIRMSVLQEYWMEERDKLVALNKQLADRYRLNASKNYVFDPQRRALIERDVPPLPQGAQEPITPSAGPSTTP